ncbi:MAG: hypothetical protein KKE24_08950 [Candidatus Thermoplasmatota archaeon]|nr:hypothetical protein [Candidatus Thermoplasmatota archaeon]
MTNVYRLVCMIAVIAMVSSSLPVNVSGADDYTLVVSPDKIKVSIISGIFSVAVTNDWPRIIFWHTNDPFSPTFEASFPRIHMFNDSDDNGVFCRSEAVGTVFFDSNHATWHLSSIIEGHTPDMGEYAMFSMSAETSVYNISGEGPAIIEDWANVTFWFCLTEKPVTYTTPTGSYIVSGKTEMRVNMTIRITNSTSADYIALERFLQGGGTTNSFVVTEDDFQSDEVLTLLSGWDDETLLGADYTRPLRQTDDVVQRIMYTKEDNASQAHFLWGTAARMSNGSSSYDHILGSSCYTTGAGLMLHSALLISNDTYSIEDETIIGIDESGFVGGVSDWIMEYLLAFVGLIAIATVSALAFYLIRKKQRIKSKTESADNLETDEIMDRV